MYILTDIELRTHWFRTHQATYTVPEDTMVTPAASDFLKEHHIKLVTGDAACSLAGSEKQDAPYGKMPMAPIPKNDKNQLKYVIAATGEEVAEKPENMTHLRGNVLVDKTHPQIAFRGKIDTLEAKIMETQTVAKSEGRDDLSDCLQGMLLFVRQILSCEVMDTMLMDLSILGLSSQEIREMSHHVQDYFGIPHPVPNYKMGKICVALNSLRTKVRETELQASMAFTENGVCTHKDLIEALNRLSSAVYILFCGELTGKRPYMKKGTCAPKAPDNKIETTCCADGIMLEASGRHVHLNEKAIEALFGKKTLTHKSDLSQPGQYAATERVKIMTSKGELDRVAVLGPARDEVQVELSLTDARILGIDVPVNMSGNLNGAADVILVGPNGMYNAVGSAIAAKAHIHMTPKDAEHFMVRDGDSVAVKVATDRPVTLDDVIVRVSDKFALAMHMDYDEANACQYKKGDLGYILR